MNRSIDEAISECEREAHVRLRCFDRWIQEGKVSRVDAWDRLERLLSAIKHLREYQTRLQQMTSEDTATAPVESEDDRVTRADFAEMHNVVDRAANFGA